MIFNAETPAKRGAVSKYLESKIKAPYVSVQVSTLGGVARASAMIRVSLDKKASWANGIFENSRYFRISLDRNGTTEQFSASYQLPKKMRKAKAKSLADAVLRINKYINAVK